MDIEECPVEGEPVMSCPTCERELLHCHGAVVRHGDGRAECTEAVGCDGDLVIHDVEVPCTEIGGACDSVTAA
jgi:hypothetical protein